MGDLSGVPLLKFALDGGARAVLAIVAEPGWRSGTPSPPLTLGTDASGAGSGPVDLVILGAGVAGLSAAVEARKQGMTFRVIESAVPLATLINFPKKKPIFTYPTTMTPVGDLQVSATIKEALVDELEAQVQAVGVTTRSDRAERIGRGTGGGLTVHLAGGEKLPARRVIVAIGRSGNFRMLGVPGEELDKVSNRLHDPADFAGRRVLVVGGGVILPSKRPRRWPRPGRRSRCRIDKAGSRARSPRTWCAIVG